MGITAGRGWQDIGIDVPVKTIFYIILRLKTAEGFEGFGTFNLGNDREFAQSLFAQLRGHDPLERSNLLQFDLMEMVDDLPVNIKMLGCTMEELAFNCKHITKELFKYLNLDTNATKG